MAVAVYGPLHIIGDVIGKRAARARGAGGERAAPAYPYPEAVALVAAQLPRL